MRDYNLVQTMQQTLERSQYVELDHGRICATYDRSKRCSLSALILRLKAINCEQSLTATQIECLQTAFTTICDRVKAKQPVWYLRIPIISCIFRACKQQVLNRAELLNTHFSECIASKLRKLNTVADVNDAISRLSKLPRNGYGYYTWQEGEKTAFLQKRPLESVSRSNIIYFDKADDVEDRINKLRSPSEVAKYFRSISSFAGLKIFADIGASSLNLSLQLPGQGHRVMTPFSKDFYENAAEYLTKIEENPLELFRQAGLYEPYARVHTHEVGAYRLYDDPVNPTKIRLIVMCSDGFFQREKSTLLDKDRNLIQNIQNFLEQQRPKPFNFFEGFDFPFNITDLFSGAPAKTPEQLLKDAKEKFLHVLDPGIDANTISFEQTLEQRKKWLRKNHSDRAVGGLDRTAEINDAWQAFIKEIQLHFRNEDVDAVILKDLDKEYPKKT